VTREAAKPTLFGLIVFPIMTNENDMPAPPKHWTILIFMVVDEDALAPYALIDLRDIRRLGVVTGFNVVTEVRWHNADPERYELRDGELELLDTPRIGMGVGRILVLREFLLDALRDHPADHYVLMLWGHAYGFGYGRPDFDRVAFQDLARVFDEFNQQRGGAKLDILACNSCRIGKVETVYELHDVVKYMVSSQVGVPFDGWPLRAVLGELTKNPALSPAQFASAMVTAYCDWYRQRTVTMSMLDLEESGKTLMLMESLGRALFAQLETPGEELQRVHEAFVRAANNEEETEPVVDLHETCLHLMQLSQSPAIKAAAAALLEALRTTAFIAKHDGTGPGSERLHGIGLFVPHVALDVGSQIYEKLGLGQARMWADAVQRLQAANKHQSVLASIADLEAETWRQAGVEPPASR